MNTESIKKLVDGAIKNEFNRIQAYEEQLEIEENKDIKEWHEKSNQILEKLLEALPEHSELLDDLDSTSTVCSTLLCEYYFKKGILEAYTNLKFLEDISNGYFY